MSIPYKYNGPIYPSLDGNVFDNPFDANAADKRYKQQQELIEQMKRQNDLLEGKQMVSTSTYTAPSDKELKRQRIINTLRDNGLDYYTIQGFINNLDIPSNAPLKLKEEYKQLKSKTTVFDTGYKELTYSLMFCVCVFFVTPFVSVAQGANFISMGAIIIDLLLMFVVSPIIVGMIKAVKQPKHSDVNRLNELENELDVYRDQLIEDLNQFRKTHYSEDAEYLLQLVDKDTFGEISKSQIKSKGTIRDYNEYFTSRYGIKINLKGSK